jgi:hypothetical protein
MSKPIIRFMEHAILNLSKAVKDNNPELTWAVLTNLDEVLGTYIEQAYKEKTKLKKKEGK